MVIRANSKDRVETRSSARVAPLEAVSMSVQTVTPRVVKSQISWASNYMKISCRNATLPLVMIEYVFPNCKYIAWHLGKTIHLGKTVNVLCEE